MEQRFRKFATLLPANPDIPIAVSHNLLPHLAHRNEVFMYPNPFRPQYWGINGEKLPSSDIIEMLLLDTTAIGPENMAIFKRLVETGTFVIEKQEDPLVLAKKVAPGADKISVVDPMTLQPPVDNIRLLVFLSDGEVHSLTPLWGRRADFELLTSEMRVPLTAGRMNTVEGFDLGTLTTCVSFSRGPGMPEGSRMFFSGSRQMTDAAFS
ncbi:MAG: hypothetical protein AMJ61_11870 [Desulfobacterales bacterium SG8_35_2]|nr:MAG: hypothetical protein AMJ61_11870 [Desulfobacterales bacterium SG8_35_2]